MKRASHIIVLLSGIASGQLLTGCSSDYWTRSDSIYFSHGDAVRSNAAVQIPDPWPKKSANTNIPMDPVKATRAIDCYRIGQKPSDQLGSYSESFAAGSFGGSGESNQNNCDYGGRGAANSSPINNGSTPPSNAYELRER